MDFQNYDDYMRNTLGFSSTVTPMGIPNTNYSNINCSNMCMNPYSNITSTQMWQDISCNLEKMYPDSYNAIYPMIISVCRTITLPITEDTLNSIVNDIYDKAGAYAIQGRFSIFIDKIIGNYTAVLGLPIQRVYEILKENDAL